MTTTSENGIHHPLWNPRDQVIEEFPSSRRWGLCVYRILDGRDMKYPVPFLIAGALAANMSLPLYAFAAVGIVTKPTEGRLTDPGKRLPVVVRNAKLERSTPADSVKLTFDLFNESETPVSDIVLSVSVLGAPRDDAPGIRVEVIRPFAILLKTVVLAGYSIHYELRLRNLSSECDCVSTIKVLEARIAPDVGDAEESQDF